MYNNILVLTNTKVIHVKRLPVSHQELLSEVKSSLGADQGESLLQKIDAQLSTIHTLEADPDFILVCASTTAPAV